MSADLVLTVPEEELEAEALDFTPNAASPYARFLVRTALVKTPGEYARTKLTSSSIAVAIALGFARLKGSMGQMFCVALNAKLEVVAIRTCPAKSLGSGYFGPPNDADKFVAETLLMASAGSALLMVPTGPLRDSDEDTYKLYAESMTPCVGHVLDMLFTDGRNTYSTDSAGYV